MPDYPHSPEGLLAMLRIRRTGPIGKAVLPLAVLLGLVAVTMVAGPVAAGPVPPPPVYPAPAQGAPECPVEKAEADAASAEYRLAETEYDNVVRARDAGAGTAAAVAAGKAPCGSGVGTASSPARTSDDVPGVLGHGGQFSLLAARPAAGLVAGLAGVRRGRKKRRMSEASWSGLV